MDHRVDWKAAKLWLGEVFVGLGECDAARVLLRLGVATPKDRLVSYRGDMPCLTLGIGWAAAREVAVSNEGAPRFRKIRLSRGSRAGQRAGA